MDFKSFRLLVAAAFIDGDLAAEEEILLERLASVLRISPETFSQILDQAHKGQLTDYDSAALRQSPIALYESVLAVVTADHVLSPEERDFMDKLGARLGVPEAELEVAWSRITLQRMPNPVYVTIVCGILLAGLQLLIQVVLREVSFFAVRNLGFAVVGIILIALSSRTLLETYQYGFRESEGNPGFGQQRGLKSRSLMRFFLTSCLFFAAFAVYEVFSGAAFCLVRLSDQQPMFEWVVAQKTAVYWSHVANTFLLSVVHFLFFRRVSALMTFLD